MNGFSSPSSSFSWFKERYIHSVFIITKVTLTAQYRNSFLGSIWSLINPMLTILILSTVFSIVMRINIPNYALYFMSGFLAWGMLTEIINSCAYSLISRGETLKHCIASYLLFPFADALVHLYRFFISFLAMQLVLSLFIVGYVHWTVILLPFVMIPLFITAVSLGTIMAYLTPYLRDLGHLVTLLLNTLYWAIPIVYPISIIPADKRIFFEFNPLYHLIRPVQDVVYYGAIPSFHTMLASISFTAIICFIAIAVVMKIRKNVIYYL